jgi:hypothetical protein
VKFEKRAKLLRGLMGLSLKHYLHHAKRKLTEN